MFGLNLPVAPTILTDQPPTDTSKPTAPSDSKITYQAEQSDDTSDERLTEPSATPVAQPKQKWCPKEDQFTNASADATTTPSSGRKSKSSFSDSSATKKRGSISMGRGSAEKPIKKRGSIGGEEKDPTTPNKATKSAASTPGIASRKRKVGPKSAADFTREDKMLIQLKKNGDSWKRIKELLGGDCDGLTLTGLRSRYRRLAVIATEWTEDDIEQLAKSKAKVEQEKWSVILKDMGIEGKFTTLSLQKKWSSLKKEGLVNDKDVYVGAAGYDKEEDENEIDDAKDDGAESEDCGAADTSSKGEMIVEEEKDVKGRKM